MARIPQDELERLKRDIDLVDLVRARGVELKANGKDLVGLCPFHEETEGSFRVSPSKNVFHCFGCGAKGTVIDLVMRFEGVTFRHAVEILRADGPATPTLAGDRPPPKKSSTVKLAQVVTEDAGDPALRTQVADYYHETLKRSPEAIAYLEKRGLDPEAVVDRFRLGFSNRTLGYHLPQKNRKDGKAIRGRLAELGIIKETGHELLRGSLVIPLFDDNDQVVQMYGRKITPNLRAGTPKHLYLPGPRRGIFNLEALRQSKEIILCEALIDAMTFVSAGFDNVTSAYGKNGFTDEMFEAFKTHGTERVLIAYDRDDKSEPAVNTLAECLGAEGISCFRVRFPHGMDANEYALKVTPPEQSLAVLLRSAEHMSGPLKTLSTVPTPISEVSRTEDSRTDPAPEKPIESGPDTEPEPVSSLAAAPEPSSKVKAQEFPDSPDASAPASPVPPAPADDVSCEIKDHEVLFHFGDRRWRVRGLAQNTSFEKMRVNLLVARTDTDHFHVDALELYSSKQRGSFLKQASVELQVKSEILKRDLGQVFRKLEQLLEQQIKKQLEPEDKTVILSDKDRADALKLLQDPKLLERINEDLETCGLVGENTNKLVAYLCAVSRKLAKPLAVLVQSSSAAGKSALMDAVLAFCPPEERVQYSAMTGQSLFYMGETDLKHKVLAIAEEEGAERASYPLKLLQSEGELTIASTGKDPKSGRLTTHEYHVEGPTAILLTTTAIDLDEELQNRCMVLAVDESREQTRAIHQMQREACTLEGLERRFARTDLLKLHQNAQRLLRPLYVVNQYSPRLTFMEVTTRTRRDHLKYLGLIEAIALVHQHQRPVKTGVLRGRRIDYVEVTVPDIATANELASEVLGRTLDELPPQTRILLEMVQQMVAEHCKAKQVEQIDFRFTRREVLDITGWSYPQVRKHLDRLTALEYILVHRGRRGHSFVYELLWSGEGKQGECFVMGLIDPEKLNNSSGTMQALTPSDPRFDPPLTPHSPPIDPPLTPGHNCGKSLVSSNSDVEIEIIPENALIPPSKKQSSYRPVVVVTAKSRNAE